MLDIEAIKAMTDPDAARELFVAQVREAGGEVVVSEGLPDPLVTLACAVVDRWKYGPQAKGAVVNLAWASLAKTRMAGLARLCAAPGPVRVARATYEMLGSELLGEVGRVEEVDIVPLPVSRAIAETFWYLILLPSGTDFRQLCECAEFKELESVRLLTHNSQLRGVIYCGIAIVAADAIDVTQLPMLEAACWAAQASAEETGWLKHITWLPPRLDARPVELPILDIARATAQVLSLEQVTDIMGQLAAERAKTALRAMTQAKTTAEACTLSYQHARDQVERLKAQGSFMDILQGLVDRGLLAAARVTKTHVALVIDNVWAEVSEADRVFEHKYATARGVDDPRLQDIKAGIYKIDPAMLLVPLAAEKRRAAILVRRPDGSRHMHAHLEPRTGAVVCLGESTVVVDDKEVAATAGLDTLWERGEIEQYVRFWRRFLTTTHLAHGYRGVWTAGRWMYPSWKEFDEANGRTDDAK